MRFLVPEKIVRQGDSLTPSTAPSVPSCPSEVEKMAAIRKAMRENTDKEVCYYENPTILFRLVQAKKFSAALERLEKNGPREASIWVCTKRPKEAKAGGGAAGEKNTTSSSRSQQQQHQQQQEEDGSSSLISGITQSFITEEVAAYNTEGEYTFRCLPIHMACSHLGSVVVDKNKDQWADLEKLICYLAIVYPAGCARRDHEGRLPLHEAIWYNASPCTVSALLMAAPEAVNEQEYKHSRGRYPIALNEHRPTPTAGDHDGGDQKEAVRKLLRLRRKYWDLARQEVRYQQAYYYQILIYNCSNMAHVYTDTILDFFQFHAPQATLRFKHRTVPSADASITSTSVLAASVADEETLFTTASAFPLGGLAQSAAAAAVGVEEDGEDVNDTSGGRILSKATNAQNESTRCREPIQPMSWSQLEKRAMLTEQKLEQLNEVNYVLRKQVIEFRAAQKDLQDKLDRYTKTDLGRLVRRLEAEKQDLQWQVQRLSGLLMRNGISLDDPDEEARFISTSPPLEVQVGDEQQNVNQPSINKNDKSISDVVQQQQQQEQEQQEKSFKDEKVHSLAAAAAATTNEPSSMILDSTESQPLQVPHDKDAISQDDDETENDHDGSYCSHYSFGTGSQQSRLEYDMQVLEEMNERVRQLVISESASDYQGKSVYPQFTAARPVQEQEQKRSCLKDPPSYSANGNIPQPLNEDEMNKKLPAKPKESFLSKKEAPQSGTADVDDGKRNITIHKKQLQATTVAAFDVTYSNDSPFTTIEEEEDEGIVSVPEPTSVASSRSGANGNSHDGSSCIASVDQLDTQDTNADNVTCNNNKKGMNFGAYMDDDLDSVIAEAVKLNGGNVLSPEMLRLWREASATSYGLSSEQLQKQQALNAGKGISPEMMRLWKQTSATTSATSFALSAITLPSALEQQQQQQQADEISAGSSSTDTRENKSPSSKKKSPPPSYSCSPTSMPCLVGAENMSTTMATKYQYLDNVYSSNGDGMGKDKAAAAAASGASSSSVYDKVASCTTKRCSPVITASPKTPPTSFYDMSICSDDMSQLFSQATKTYPRGGGGGGLSGQSGDDCAASTCSSSNDVSI
jgi:hypothetical protein